MARNKLSPLEKSAREEISSNLKKLTAKRGLTQQKLSDLTGIPPSTLSGYFAKRSTPNAGTLQKIADALKVKKSDIDSRYLQTNNIAVLGMHYIKVPIVGTIACGTPITAEQNIEGYTHELFDEEPKGNLFALRCKGDSMEPLIPDGAIVLINEQPTVEDDEIAAVLVDDDTEATLKKVKHTHDGQVMLLPINTEKYDPILLNKENPGRILGKAIHVGFDM